MAQPYYGHNQYGLPNKGVNQQPDRGSDTESDSESDSASYTASESGTQSDTGTESGTESESCTGSESHSDSYAAQTNADSDSEEHRARASIDIAALPSDTNTTHRVPCKQQLVRKDPTQIMQQMQQQSRSVMQFHQPQTAAPQNNYQRSLIMQQMQQPFMSKSAMNFYPPPQQAPPMMQPMVPMQPQPMPMHMQPMQPQSPNQLQMMAQMQQLSMSVGNLNQSVQQQARPPPQHRYQKSAHIMRQMKRNSKSMLQFNNGNVNRNMNQQNYSMQQPQRQGLVVQQRPIHPSSQRSLYQQQARNINGSSPNLRQNNRPRNNSKHGYSASQSNMNQRSFVPQNKPRSDSKHGYSASQNNADHGSFLPPAPQSAQEQNKYGNWKAKRKAMDEQKAIHAQREREKQAARDAKEKAKRTQFGKYTQQNNHFRVVIQHQ
eukprot:187427_1